jgi:tubulin polyglutamylase TTLL5
MWWRGRYPGYQDADFPTPSELLVAEGTDSALLNEVNQLLPQREYSTPSTPSSFVTFTPVNTSEKSSKEAPKKRRPFVGNYLGNYRLTNTDAPLVKETLEFNGFNPAINNQDWLVQWSGPHLRDCFYSGLHQYQRVNHFPGSTELTRKDLLWKHFRNMQKVFGKANFNFMPDTYVLPDQLDDFLVAYERQDCFWIVKPTASSRGRGIFLLRDLEELPMDSAIISMYVERPMLIQGLKFDLRLYVLVTGFDPLRIYIYREGLTRFASSTFSTDTEEDLKDVYKHLTNYSVNKFAHNFVENQDANLDNFGHKWSISALNKHLKCLGVDIEALWGRIIDVVIKTLLAVERAVNNRTKNMVMWRQNCFELYGFDILIDEDVKPWLLEVNLSPSMQADSPLDRRIKAHLLAEALNLIRIRPCDSKALGQARWRTRALQLKRRLAPMRPQSCPDRSTTQRAPKDTKQRHSLENLSEKHLRLLSDVLTEFGIAENFIRVFPTSASVRRYGHMLHSTTSSGKFTATLALINLLFNEKRMISSEFRERRPRFPAAMDLAEIESRRTKLKTDATSGEEGGEDDKNDSATTTSTNTGSSYTASHATSNSTSRGRRSSSSGTIHPYERTSSSTLPYPLNQSSTNFHLSLKHKHTARDTLHSSFHNQEMNHDTWLRTAKGTSSLNSIHNPGGGEPRSLSTYGYRNPDSPQKNVGDQGNNSNHTNTYFTTGSKNAGRSNEEHSGSTIAGSNTKYAAIPPHRTLSNSSLPYKSPHQLTSNLNNANDKIENRSGTRLTRPRTAESGSRRTPTYQDFKNPCLRTTRRNENPIYYATSLSGIEL